MENIKSGISQQQLIESYSKSSNGRRPQNNKSLISQKQLIGYYSNVKL
jgi:hypothetical protein